MFFVYVVRCIVQSGRGCGIPKRPSYMSACMPLCARNSEVGGGCMHGHTFFSTTTRRFRSKRPPSKVSRALSVLSAIYRQPFGFFSTESCSRVTPKRSIWSLFSFIHSVEAELANVMKREWKYSRIRAEKFHRWMTQSRSIPLPAGQLLSTNVSSIMGHTSFIMLAFGFMERDVVLLRSYAIGGITASILFQYYRAQPLWLPISWNIIFLLINGAMITALIKERAEASHLEPEEAEVFSECYDKFGVDPVDFLRVIRLAKKRRISEGTILAKAGDPQKELHLVVAGEFKVSDPDGLSLGHIRKNQYIGSMAFLRFMNSTIAYEERSKGGLRALVAASHPHTNPEEEKDDHSKKESPPRVPSDSLVDAVVNATESMEALSGPLKSMVNDPDSQSKPNEADIPPNFEKEAFSRSTVIAETASDVYTWDIHALVDFVRERPQEQHALSISIGADLSEKIDQSRGVDINYHNLLEAALRFGVVLPLEKKKLQAFRKEHRISIEKHDSMLNELGWTKNDFNEGVHYVEVSPNFSRYSDMLTVALKHGVLTDEEKVKLWVHRQELGIDSQEHLLLLNKLGWTLDQYEFHSRLMLQNFN